MDNSPTDPPRKPVDEVTGSNDPILPQPRKSDSTVIGSQGEKSQWSNRRKKRREFITNLCLSQVEKHGELSVKELGRLVDTLTTYSPGSQQIGQYLRASVKDGTLENITEWTGGQLTVYYRWNGNQDQS